MWTGRDDGPRVHHVINGQEKGYALLGFASDTGVKRNLGRVGAANGPDAFRKAFANMPLQTSHLGIKDFGNITCQGDALEKAQKEFTTAIKKLWKQRYKPFCIGGGHEISFPHYVALAETFPDETIGIINLDAHLDLREGVNSGSSFLQISQLKKPFHYLCLGCDPYSTSLEMWDRLEGKAIFAEEIVRDPKKAIKEIVRFLKKVDKVYLTIDLDVFSAGFAPGVSAPNAMGISPYDALPLIRAIKPKMLSFDIAELNPQYDTDGRTAKLAAALAMELLS